MTTPTSDELTVLYSGMSNEQLMSIAGEYETLTGAAQTALRVEFAKRRLDPPEVSDPGPDEAVRELVIVARYRDLPEGQLARSLLESAGIPCFLRDENTVRNDWLLSNLMGGMRLMVNADDREAATAILSDATSSSLNEADDPL
jgi:hypothetical protein